MGLLPGLHLCVLVFVCCLVPLLNGAPIDILDKLVSEEKAKEYLSRFGYYQPIPLPRNTRDPASLENIRRAQFSLALKKFQQFAGVEITGVLDDGTKKVMTYRRCGVSDLDRLARKANPLKWTKNYLTWSIDEYTRDLPHGEARRALHDAFHAWSGVTPLQFTEVQSDSRNPADLRIKFGAGGHGDRYPFDGPNGVLAHAMYPKDGSVHFDDAEQWVYNDPDKATKYEYADLLSVGIHELGHALGLPHSTNDEAIMAAFYKAPVKDGKYVKPTLHQDDVHAIQKLYGSANGETPAPILPRHRGLSFGPRTTTTTADQPATYTTATQQTTTTTETTTIPTTTTTQTTTTTAEYVTTTAKFSMSVEGNPEYPKEEPQEEHCPARIDAATKASNGRSYVFDQTLVWEFHRDGQLRHRRRIDQVFPDGPTTVTAAYTTTQSITVLFQGRRLWAYLWNEKTLAFELQSGFPKELTELVPFTPRLAFSWRDGNTVIVDGKDFAIYDEYWNTPTLVQTTDNYFLNLPPTGDAAVALESNTLLVVEGETYYLYDMERQELVEGYPRPLSSFLRC